jgi:hypothetical protein
VEEIAPYGGKKSTLWWKDVIDVSTIDKQLKILRYRCFNQEWWKDRHPKVEKKGPYGGIM